MATTVVAMSIDASDAATAAPSSSGRRHHTLLWFYRIFFCLHSSLMKVAVEVFSENVNERL